MAVAVHDGLAFHLRRTVIGLVDQKFAQDKRLVFQAGCVFVMAQQVGHLVAKN